MRVLWLLAAFMPWVGLLAQIPLLRVLAPLEEGDSIPIPYTEVAISLAGVVLGFASVAAFTVHAARNQRLASRHRGPWIAALILANGLALPAYWWRHLRDA